MTTPTLGTPNGTTRRIAYDAAVFGRALVSRSDVSDADWRLAREVAKQNRSTELRALLDLGLIGEDPLANALSAAMGYPRWRGPGESGGSGGEGTEAPPAVSDALPVEFMRTNSVLALEEPGGIRVVVCDPGDHFVMNAIALELGPRAADIAVGTQKEIQAFLESASPASSGLAAAAEEAVDVSGELSQLRELASEAPVIRFFNQTIERAVELGASDVHIERFDRRISLRFRIDGVLIEQPPPPAALYEPLLCRVKILSNLDIAERRRSQDGRIQLRLRGRNLDLRVSIVPTVYGQDAAIRLQDRQRLAEISMSDLGFDPAHIKRLLAVASKSHGILLITGPTGSGKTTSLYAILKALASKEQKIITIEDPVEYAMDGINQIQVNASIGLTFGTTLRNILRHDPDVILVGEIRDRETAEMAFQSALTGHMVLSTLHTNDVPSSFVRLLDMGVEPYLVNAAIEAVSAQRLVRKLNPAMRHRPDAPPQERYRGRVAVMELAEVTPEIKRLIVQGADEHRIREALLQSGFLPMRADAQRLIDAGITDEAEVARVLGTAAAVATGIGGPDTESHRNPEHTRR
jgi:general secretion pathway protein E